MFLTVRNYIVSATANTQEIVLFSYIRATLDRLSFKYRRALAMVIADFYGSEAEELRRAILFHRSDERMKKIAVKLRRNMERKGIDLQVQEEIVNTLSSFALYGFPESRVTKANDLAG